MKYTESKFTKGNWYTKKNNMGGIQVFYPHGFLTSSSVINVDDTRLEGESWLAMRKRIEPIQVKANIESNANMYLIASSPDLYHEIEDDIRRLESITSLNELAIEYDQIMVHLKRKRELLAKARGKINE